MHTKDMFKLDGKVAIVTGGYGLYGRNISTALCEAGATVIVASRNLEKCRTLADKLNAGGYKAEGMQLDQGDEASITGFVKGVIDKYGKIDILVNNAVLRVANADLEDVTAEALEKAAKVNTIGLMLITKAVVKQMRKQGSGNIINISSIRGVDGPHFPVYGNTGMTSGIHYSFEKWGMVGFTKWISNYYGKYNIRANCISPGGYSEEDEGVKEENNEFATNYKNLTPMGRFAHEDDIKGPIVFLASEASSYVTGHNLLVDGGWTNW